MPALVNCVAPQKGTNCLYVQIDLFTDTAAILNSIVLTEKLWAAEGAIAGKFIV